MEAIIAMKLAGVTCVVNKGGTGGTEENKSRIAVPILSKFIDLFLSESKYEFQKHIKNKLPYKKMVVVHSGVDTSMFFPLISSSLRIRDEFGISAHQKIIISVSRFDFGKGHLDLINAAEIVIKYFPEAIFFIAGDDLSEQNIILKKQIKFKIDNSPYRRNFILAGWRTDIPEILRESDIFVHCPTGPEGLGIATLEALASAKPTIITPSGGLLETTVDGYNGFIVPIGDYEKLAEKIMVLLKDNKLRIEMGKNSRQRAEDLFNIKKNVKKIEDLLLEQAKKND
jgi:hypothetical protein